MDAESINKASLLSIDIASLSWRITWFRVRRHNVKHYLYLNKKPLNERVLEAWLFVFNMTIAPNVISATHRIGSKINGQEAGKIMAIGEGGNGFR